MNNFCRLSLSVWFRYCLSAVFASLPRECLFEFEFGAFSRTFSFFPVPPGFLLSGSASAVRPSRPHRLSPGFAGRRFPRPRRSLSVRFGLFRLRPELLSVPSLLFCAHLPSLYDHTLSENVRILRIGGNWWAKMNGINK